jgi:adenosylcobinamide-phosphate synthase
MTAVLVAACRPAAARRVLTVVGRDAATHPSPNAGVAEAAFAAALGLRLEGVNYYHGRPHVIAPLGDGRGVARDDISRAVRISREVTVALAGLLAAGGLTRSARR